MGLRLLFLDIDGVLNSRRSAIALRGYGHMVPNILSLSEKQVRNKALLDPIAVKLLRHVIERSGCRIVLSSTWRMGASLQEIDYLLQSHCLPPAHGRTSVFDTGVRGDEIQAYLTSLQAKDVIVDDYVILDDDSDMLPEQLPHFYLINREIGLSASDYEALRVRWFPAYL